MHKEWSFDESRGSIFYFLLNSKSALFLVLLTTVGSGHAVKSKLMTD